MKKVAPSLLLKQLILEAEAHHQSEREMLIDDFHRLYESIQPLNLIKNTFKEVISDPHLKTNLVKGAIGLTTGFIAKKLFIRKSNNPLSKLLGVILEMVVATEVQKIPIKLKPSQRLW